MITGKTVAGAVMCTALAGLLPASSFAGPSVSGGELIGWTELDIGQGILANVEFVDGTCAELFSGCDDPVVDFPFWPAIPVEQMSILASALAASGYAPDNIRGCDDAFRCRVVTPYGGLCCGSVIGLTAIVAPGMYDHGRVGSTAVGRAEELASEPSHTFAVWSNQRPIPEPGRAALAGIGIAMLLLVGRRRRRARQRSGS